MNTRKMIGKGALAIGFIVLLSVCKGLDTHNANQLITAAFGMLNSVGGLILTRK